MEDQYGMADLRHLMTARPHFPGVLTPTPAADLFPAAPHYGMLMTGREMMPRATAGPHLPAAAGTGSSGAIAGPFMEGDLGCLGGDGGTGRWPRQETLTLLEIRSRLDHKFKEANQKGPLWDEVSRIMGEEHGYQRSGKKCREKFENLYKYYKKTKEGKAGRQDGKHYRFFRQLEALYGGGTGESYAPRFVGSNPYSVTPAAAGGVGDNRQEAFPASLSLSSSSYADSSSSEDCSGEAGEKRRRRSWKAKVREFVDGQMRRLMEKQEAWLDGMLRTLEHKEQERILRDEEWRRQEASRLDREHRFWANERAWIRVRDAALLEALQKLSDGGGDRLPKPSSPEELMVPPPEIHDGGGETHPENGNENCGDSGDRWCEGEITRLIHLRAAMEPRFQHGGCPEEVIWEEIAAEMGFERSGAAVKQKWDSINEGLAGGGRDRSTRGFCSFPMTADAPAYRPGGEAAAREAAVSNGAATQDGCFRFLMSDGGGDHSLWESYGLRLKGGNH